MQATCEQDDTFSAPWPWPDDLDKLTWPRYSKDVIAQHNLIFYISAVKNYSIRDRQTDIVINDRQSLRVATTTEILKFCGEFLGM